MFNKQQRSVLSKLSQTIWNTETRWQKLYDNGSLDIVDSQTEIDEAVDQVQLNNSKKGRGTIYNKETALTKNAWRDTPDTVKVQKVVKRRPTYEELVLNLADIARATVYAFLNNEQLINALVIDLLAGEKVSVKLTSKEDEQYKKDVEDLQSRLPEDLKPLIVSQDNGLPVDAVAFLSEVLFANAHKTEALEIYRNSLDLARVAKQSALRKRQVQQRLGL